NARLERQVVGRADIVVFTCEETAEVVMDKYPRTWRDKVRVIPHAYDSELYPGGAVAGRSETVVRYIGNLYGHRNAEPLFASLARISRSTRAALDGVRIELVGSFESDPRALPSARDLRD